MSRLNAGDYVVAGESLGHVVMSVGGKVEVKLSNGVIAPFKPEDVAQVDFIISNAGSVYQFEPVSVLAKDWVQENVQIESWQWLGRTFCVDHRLAHNLIDGIADNGFIVA